VSRDEDLLREGNRMLMDGEEFAGVISGHQLRVSIGEMVLDLELIANASNAVEWLNKVQHLPLR